MNEIVEIKTEKIPETIKAKVRSKIMLAEEALRSLPNALEGDSPEYLKVCPLKHSFGDGCYIREIFMPKGLLIVTKIHKITHPYFLLKGDCSVLTEEGVKRIKAPFHGITPAGTKRLIYVHKDTIWVTVHVTKEKDLSKIEDEIIAKSYAEMDLIIDEADEQKKMMNFIEGVKKEEECCEN